MTTRNVAPPTKKQLVRYHALLKRVRPDFSECEARLVREVLGGIAFEARQDVVPQLHLAFSQAPDTCYKKWGVDKQSFVERVQDFSQSEGLAVVDAVEKFFAGKAHHARPSGTCLCDLS
jgi:hypothetical protein